MSLTNNNLTLAALILLTTTTCTAQEEYLTRTYQSPTYDGAVTSYRTVTEIADAATATASWEVIADGVTKTFVSESATDGYTSTWTQVAASHRPAPHRTSTQDAAASSSSVASYEAFLATQSEKLGPHTMIPVFMPTQPGLDNDDIITALGSVNGTTTWGAVAIHSVWDFTDGGGIHSPANTEAYNSPYATFTSAATTFVNSYTITRPGTVCTAPAEGRSTIERSWWCSNTTIAAANPIPSSILQTMKHADYTAWGTDKDITRSAVCTQTAVLIRDGKTTKSGTVETSSWVETNKVYVIVVGEVALTIGKEASATDGQTTAAQTGSAAGSASPSGAGEPPSTTAQAAGAAEVTVFVNAVAFVAAVAAFAI